MSSKATESTFRQRLRIERERLGLTQAEFAELGGVSRMAQWKYENGDYFPSVEYLLALEQSRLQRDSGVDLVYLLRGHRLTSQLIDWDVVQDAFGFVCRHMIQKPGNTYSADQLFEAFKHIWALTMDITHGGGVTVSDALKNIEALTEDDHG